jgi:hypothetical protein
MNRIAKSAVFACALAALASQPIVAQEEVKDYPGAPDPTSYGYTVLALGIGTPFALPWGFDWDIFGLDVNVVYGDCNKMYGLEVAGLANTARLDMLGLQAAAGCNFANRDAIGAQVAMVNLGNRTTYGLSVDIAGLHRDFLGLGVDGLIGAYDSEYYGLEVAGLGSAVREDMWGWQIGLGANFARRVHGFQTALLFNMTEELRGAQLGLVNYASTCSAGFQIGLLNFIMDNQIPVLPIFNCYF